MKKVNTDCIDLLYLHMWDCTTSVQEIIRAVDDQVIAEKEDYIGFSDIPASIETNTSMLADSHALMPILAIQVPDNILHRDPERELIPAGIVEEDIAVTAWGLLGGGLLTGKYKIVSLPRNDMKKQVRKHADTANKKVEISNEIDRSPAQVTIGWVRQQQASARFSQL